MSETLAVGDLVFELRRSDRRRTVGITVDRGGELVVLAPSAAALDDVKRVVAAKSAWVHRKLAEKELLLRAASPKEYVTGEGFYYLGRRHRLRLYDPGHAAAPAQGLRLHQGRFLLPRDSQSRARELFTDWYMSHGQSWIEPRARLLAERLGVHPEAVLVRPLGHRWGSCGKTGRIHIHWRTVLLPPRIIEYVAAHELAHLREPRHSDEFRRRLSRAIPDCEQRRQWLRECGAWYT